MLDAEALASGVLGSRESHHGSAAHVLLLNYDALHTGPPIVVERIFGMFEQAFALARLARRHRRRNVDQPTGIDAEAGHDLKRGRRVLGRNEGRGTVSRDDAALAGHIVEPEHAVGTLLQAGRGRVREGQGTDRVGIDAVRRDAYQFAFGIS